MTRDARTPPGLDGFQLAEFAGPDPGATKALFEQLDCFAVSRHATKAVARYNEGPLNLLADEEPTNQAVEFRAAHGAWPNGMTFRVADAARAFDEARKRRAWRPTPARALGEGSPRAMRSSISAPRRKPGTGMGLYAVARAGVARLTEILAVELAGHVRVNAGLPLILDTPQNRRDMPQIDPGDWMAPGPVGSSSMFHGVRRRLSDQRGAAADHAVRVA